MPPVALGLLAFSAVLHASWNLLLKQAPNKFILSWWSTVIGSGGALPVLLWVGLPPPHMWPFLLASVAAEAAYFALLSRAYQRSDFSIVYPLARGSVPIFLTLWSIIFLHEMPSPAGFAGLGLIVLGLGLVGFSEVFTAGKTNSSLKGVWPALGTALLISIYTIIDGAAVKQGPSLPYALGIFALVPVAFTPLVLRRYSWEQLAEGWTTQKWRVLAVGTLGLAAYVIVLSAYQIAPLSYAGAIREMSVIFGALAGWLLLKERFGPFRVAGAALMFGGILLIALFG